MDTSLKQDWDTVLVLESEITHLVELSKEIKGDSGLTQEIAFESEVLFGDNSLLNTYFSSVPSSVKQQAALEALGKGVWTAIIAGLVALVAIFTKLWKWIRGDSQDSPGSHFLSETAIKELEKESNDIAMHSVPLSDLMREPNDSIGAAAHAMIQKGEHDGVLLKPSPEHGDFMINGPYFVAHHQAIATLRTLKLSRTLSDCVQLVDTWDSRTVNHNQEALEKEYAMLASHASAIDGHVETLHSSIVQALAKAESTLVTPETIDEMVHRANVNLTALNIGDIGKEKGDIRDKLGIVTERLSKKVGSLDSAAKLEAGKMFEDGAEADSVLRAKHYHAAVAKVASTSTKMLHLFNELDRYFLSGIAAIVELHQHRIKWAESAISESGADAQAQAKARKKWAAYKAQLATFKKNIVDNTGDNAKKKRK
jgi:hypothetical protein